MLSKPSHFVFSICFLLGLHAQRRTLKSL
jgi:hypothetical protein